MQATQAVPQVELPTMEFVADTVIAWEKKYGTLGRLPDAQEAVVVASVPIAKTTEEDPTPAVFLEVAAAAAAAAEERAKEEAEKKKREAIERMRKEAEEVQATIERNKAAAELKRLDLALKEKMDKERAQHQAHFEAESKKAEEYRLRVQEERSKKEAEEERERSMRAQAELDAHEAELERLKRASTAAAATVKAEEKETEKEKKETETEQKDPPAKRARTEAYYPERLEPGAFKLPGYRRSVSKKEFDARVEDLAEYFSSSHDNEAAFRNVTRIDFACDDRGTRLDWYYYFTLGDEAGVLAKRSKIDVYRAAVAYGEAQAGGSSSSGAASPDDVWKGRYVFFYLVVCLLYLGEVCTIVAIRHSSGEAYLWLTVAAGFVSVIASGAASASFSERSSAAWADVRQRRNRYRWMDAAITLSLTNAAVIVIVGNDVMWQVLSPFFISIGMLLYAACDEASASASAPVKERRRLTLAHAQTFFLFAGVALSAYVFFQYYSLPVPTERIKYNITVVWYYQFVGITLLMVVQLTCCTRLWMDMLMTLWCFSTRSAFMWLVFTLSS